jgi:UPF0755 protein
MGGAFRKLLIAVAILGSLALLGVCVSYWYLMRWAERPLAGDIRIPADTVAEDRGRVVQLNPGETLATLALQLQQQGLLDGRQRLVLLGRLSGLDTQLQAGEYRIDPQLTPRLLLRKLAAGDVVTYEFRIEEGSTVAMMLGALAAQEPLTHSIRATDAVALHAELKLSAPFAEGMFFPDTYQYRRGDLDRDLLLRAHEAMQQLLAATWQARADDLQVTTAEDAVILASIIEKESGLTTDRALISQVFHNRLAERMLLQTDPTVIYALGDAFDGNLTRAHLKIDSPYNTYRYRGLPPTPIALPSAAALHAAVHPAPGDYYYFVAKGDGSSQFSRTLAEHNRAVRKYQLGEHD